MQVIRNISDTARWAAVFRANESRRPDALFHDPYAARLAGERGEEIAREMRFHQRNSWAWVMRTVIADQYITEQIAAGVDIVVNLAAGLDARPYRMQLPPNLRWIEVDLPELMDYKEEILAGETPACRLKRVRMDLGELRPRRALFDRLGLESAKALVITEGLLVYLSPEEVGSLADDLARPRGFQLWIADVISPGLREMMMKNEGQQLVAAGAPFKFAPPEGPDFFLTHGWRAKTVRSTFRTAAQLKRLPLLLRLFALLPDPKGPPGKRPWSGICLFEKNV